MRTPLGSLVLLSFATLALQGCSGSSSASPSAGPAIASVTPASGTLTTIVGISGSGFSGSAGSPPSVIFTPSSGGPGYPAQVTAVSETGVDAVVPAMPPALAASGTAFDVTVTNPGGGSSTRAHAFTMATPTLTDINGGLVGSGSAGSAFILDGAAFGDPASLTTAFSVDFCDPVTSTVSAAAVAGDGWTNAYVVGVVPNGLSTGTTYAVTVTTPSGTSAPRGFKVVAGVSFSPSTIQWSATSSLPVAQQGFSTVVATIGTSSFIYALGGNTATTTTSDGKAANVRTVYVNRIDDSTGALADPSWSTTATPLPAERGFAAAVVADSFNSVVPGTNVYVLGGLDPAGVATSTVYYAALHADGAIPAAGAAGTWTATTPLPQALFAHGAVVFHGRIYVAGGNDATEAPVSKVYSARIDADGTLADWQTLPDLPAALAYHQLVTFTGYLYALGGDTAAVDPISNVAAGSSQADVYLAKINIRNGGVVNDAWLQTSPLTKAREKFTAIVAGDYVLVSGGLYAGDAPNPSSESSCGQFNADGTVQSFVGATGTNTIYTVSGNADDFYNHAAAYFVDATGAPHVLILGGADVKTGNVHTEVWYQH